MRELDDTVTAGVERTTLRALHAAGRIVPQRMDHMDADDWQAGGDLHYVQDKQSGDMWPVSRQTWLYLGGGSNEVDKGRPDAAVNPHGGGAVSD